MSNNIDVVNMDLDNPRCANIKEETLEGGETTFTVTLLTEKSDGSLEVNKEQVCDTFVAAQNLICLWLEEPKGGLQ